MDADGYVEKRDILLEGKMGGWEERRKKRKGKEDKKRQGIGDDADVTYIRRRAEFQLERGGGVIPSPSQSKPLGD